MTETKLKEYPRIVDPELDFEATRTHFGRGSCNYAVGEQYVSSVDRTVVFLRQQRESDQVIWVSGEIRRICEQGIVISGYRAEPTGLFKFLKQPKIETIPDGERKLVKSELLNSLPHSGIIKYVEFSD